MSSRKNSIRQKREQEKEERKQKYREQQPSVAAVNSSAMIGCREKVKEEKNLTVQKKKSLAKAAGLKSTFVINDGLVMTSFGRGNDAVVEKKISGTVIASINDPPKFEAKYAEEKKGYDISGRIIKKAQTDDPRVSKKAAPGLDAIRCKDVLEKRYFGKTFSDNIHIQLIYNILDIEKILAVHINNIIFELNNIRRKENSEYDDFIGYLSTRNNYATFCNPSKYIGQERAIANMANLKIKFDEFLKNPRIAYFGNAFYETGYDIKQIQAAKLKSEEEIYYILCMLGDVRQHCMHDMNKTRALIYNLNSDCFLREAKDVLDSIYNKKIKSINDDFIKINNVNFSIIFKALKITDKDEKRKIIQDFYNFVVYKHFKNLGFSIKTLRENMLEIPDAAEIKKQKFDTMRSKLYKIIDFIIYEYYINDTSGLIDKNVEALRSTLNDSGKNMFYSSEAGRLWKCIGQTISSGVLPLMNEDSFKPAKADNDITANMLNGVKLGTETDYFCKLVYLMTLFLDGKEINDLLTTLINKFENIQSFVDVLNTTGISCNFKSDYTMFAGSKEIAANLRAVNSFARMQSPTVSAKKIMFIEAAEILGTGMSDEKLNEEADKILGGTKKSSSGKNNKGSKADTGFRNFLANNVIESSRFKYLIRYNNAKKTRAIAQNRIVIKFVLGTIPPAQIDSYYESCDGKGANDTEGKIEILTDIITGLKFDDFKIEKQNTRNATDNVKQNKKNEMADKMKKQAIIGLYLTVLYLATKNLVYVNSRYTLAFHCMERDAQLHDSPAGFKSQNYCALTQKFIVNNWLKSRQSRYISENISAVDDEVIRIYRNNIAHLSAVRNADLFIGQIRNVDSYFALYHFLMQKTIEQELIRLKKMDSVNPKIKEYLDSVSKYNSYCKDFVKALNTPFGYNLPRYKNLSIGDLFDKNCIKPSNESLEIKI